MKCSACDKMMKLAKENRFDMDEISRLERTKQMILYGGTCKLEDLPYLLRFGPHDQANLVYVCIPCNHFYYFEVNRDGRASIDLMTDQEADEKIDTLTWGHVGIVFERWAPIEVKITRDSVNMIDDMLDHDLTITMNYYDSWLKLFREMMEMDYLPTSPGEDAIWVLEDADYNEIFTYNEMDERLIRQTEHCMVGDLCYRSEEFHLNYYPSKKNRESYLEHTL